MQLTYKEWDKVAQEVIYTKVSFDSYRKLDIKLVKVMGTLVINKELRVYVKSLNYQHFEVDILTASLQLLAEVYPNMQKIEVKYVDENFYKALLQEIQIGNFKHLKYVPLPRDRHNISQVKAYEDVIVSIPKKVENILWCPISKHNA